MKNEIQNPAQYKQVPFPLGDEARILDIRYDPVFKAVFTKDTAPSRGALSGFISALMGRTVSVETVTVNESPIDDLQQQYLCFNATCKAEKGELVNVEMSFNHDANEPARLEYYVARSFIGQVVYGEDKTEDDLTEDDLKETCQIVILAKEKFFPDESFMHDFAYYDPDARISFGGRSRIITVELVKTKSIVDKPVEEMANAELWAVFFQYLTDPEKREKIIEIINHEEGIAMAAETLGTLTQDELEYIRKIN